MIIYISVIKLKNKIKENLYKLSINKKSIAGNFFKSTLIAILLYVLGILLSGIKLELNIGYKLYFDFIFIFYMPFLIDNIFNRYKFSEKLKNLTYILNIIMTSIYSIYEIFRLNKIFIGFNSLFIFSILIFLVNSIMQKFISKEKVENIRNWGGVLILFITGVIFLIK